MLIRCGVGVLEGVMVGLAVSVGWGVLLGDGVVDGVRVVLAITLVAAGIVLAGRLAVFSTAGLQLLINRRPSRQKLIPAVTLSKDLIYPKYSFIISGCFLRRELYATQLELLSNDRNK
jgi:hypothetical protein